MSKPKIAILKTEKSFLPEAAAYQDFFSNHGYPTKIVESHNYKPEDHDIVILFHGFHPFWKKYSAIKIGEYHSLSTGTLNRIKDLAKRLINTRSDINIFLNKEVRKKMFFFESKKTKYRPMGYSKPLIEKNKGAQKEFDVIYAGSIRDGVTDAIINLANLGLKVAVAGNQSPITHKNIKNFGRLDQESVYALISKSRFGLSYTPDIHPYNIQDSTKIIEYCAMGIGVITNSYSWTKDFEKKRNCNFIKIENITSRETLLSQEHKSPDISDLNWHSVMTKSGILEKLEEVIQKKLSAPQSTSTKTG